LRQGKEPSTDYTRAGTYVQLITVGTTCT